MAEVTLDIPDEINDRLTAIARRSGIPRGEAFKRALALLFIADEERDKGNTLLVADAEFRPLTQLVGIFK
jgi:predicted transcriptional regulator